MAIPVSLGSPVATSLPLSRVPLLLAALFFFAWLARRISTYRDNYRPLPGVPLVSVRGLSARDSYRKHGTETVLKGLAENPDSPFQVMTGVGPKLVVPNKYARAISIDKNMSLGESLRSDFMPHYAGMDGVRIGIDSSVIRDTIVRKLTQSLALVTGDLVEETAESLHDELGESTEWTTVELKTPVSQVIARLTSRVFLGKTLCRTQQWLDIAKNYTLHSFGAMRELRAVPAWFRWVKQWFIPTCIDLRRDVVEAHALIDVECNRREQVAKDLLAQGKKPPKKYDAIAWFVEMSGELGIEIDLVAAQLALSLAAIHTTTEATCQALTHLAKNPQWFQPLRDEIIEVIGQNGWTRSSIYQFKLMDSFLKESQRLSRGIVSLQRIALDDVVFPDGLRIAKGTRILIENKVLDPETWPNPDKFDASRFMKLSEETGQASNWQYVSNQPEHMGFGIGYQACPGRFFAANELKIALAHLILKYDWSIDPVRGAPETFVVETEMIVHPQDTLRYRRRKEEIDLDSTAAAAAADE